MQWYVYKAEQIAMALFRQWIRCLADIHITSGYNRVVQGKVIHQGRKCKQDHEMALLPSELRPVAAPSCA